MFTMSGIGQQNLLSCTSVNIFTEYSLNVPQKKNVKMQKISVKSCGQVSLLMICLRYKFLTLLHFIIRLIKEELFIALISATFNQIN